MQHIAKDCKRIGSEHKTYFEKMLNFLGESAKAVQNKISLTFWGLRTN